MSLGIIWKSREINIGTVNGGARQDLATTKSANPWTPFVGLALAETGGRTWRSGVRWTLGPDVAFGVEGTLRKAAYDNPGGQGVAFRFTAQ